MSPQIARAFGVLLLLAVPAIAPAEEYDVTIVFKDEAPVVVPFLRCERNGVVVATEEAPATCRREVETNRTFAVTAARITNVGSSVIYVHIGTARLSVMPGKHFRRILPGGGPFSRVFLSGEPGGRAHVFVANPVEDEPEPPRKAAEDR